MSTSSHNHRDTPLRRFNTFWWGLAYFGLFGLVSAVVVNWTGSKPDAAELVKNQRQETVKAVALKQEEALSGKALNIEKMSVELKKAPSAAVGDPIGNAVRGKELFKTKTCFTCHGADGNKPIATIYPKLGGKQAPYLAKRMKDIKSGAHATALTPQMKPFIDQVSDQEINDIAQWLADGSK